MIRNLLAILLCMATLVVGVITSSLAAKNRVRANDLDHLQRCCEAQLRHNENLRVEGLRAQWDLLSDTEEQLSVATENPVFSAEI